jgi:hypothetical protein
MKSNEIKIIKKTNSREYKKIQMNVIIKKKEKRTIIKQHKNY